MVHEKDKEVPEMMNLMIYWMIIVIWFRLNRGKEEEYLVYQEEEQNPED